MSREKESQKRPESRKKKDDADTFRCTKCGARIADEGDWAIHMQECRG